MAKRRSGRLPILAALACQACATTSEATWSIVLVDEDRREVAVGTITCLTDLDLLAIVPVVVVREGAAAVQAAGDFGGQRRPIIFAGFQNDVSPSDILIELEGVSGHQQRQYGIVDTNEAVTFTGSETLDWAGGVTGKVGSLRYAIQGNILVGPCVVESIETAVLATDGPIEERLLAGMVAARDAGGDGRCSCTPSDPTSCGCPPAVFDKAGHIGGMIVARPTDTDDGSCTSQGCADGNYYMRLNVANQSASDPDPMQQLEALYDEWWADLDGRVDVYESTVSFDPPEIPADGTSTTTMTIALRDRDGEPITVDISNLTASHLPGSAGISSIGSATETGGGVWEVTLTAGTDLGRDRFQVKISEGDRSIRLLPEFVYPNDGDVNGNGVVDVVDLLQVLSSWGACPAPCPADLDFDGQVNVADLLRLLAHWGV